MDIFTNILAQIVFSEVPMCSVVNKYCRFQKVVHMLLFRWVDS